MSTPYHHLANLAVHPDASALAHALARWHDRMVAHLRRPPQGPAGACCPDEDECPRDEAVGLWEHARAVFGARADELVFLRRHAVGDAS